MPEPIDFDTDPIGAIRQHAEAVKRWRPPAVNELLVPEWAYDQAQAEGIVDARGVVDQEALGVPLSAIAPNPSAPVVLVVASTRS